MFPINYFKIKGHSMEPTFHEGDRLLINKWAYTLSKPRVGDVVVFKKLNEEKYILKRIRKILNTGFFVRGDNKNDSKSFGVITETQIIGKVLASL